MSKCFEESHTTGILDSVLPWMAMNSKSLSSTSLILSIKHLTRRLIHAEIGPTAITRVIFQGRPKTKAEKRIYQREEKKPDWQPVRMFATRKMNFHVLRIAEASFDIFSENPIATNSNHILTSQISDSAKLNYTWYS